MSKSKRLTVYEKGQIDALRSQNLTERQIAQQIVRSKTVVHNYIRLRKNYGLKGKRGRNKKLSKTQIRAIIRAAKGKIVSAAKIKDEFGFNVSVRTIQRVLSTSPILFRTKLKQKQKLTKFHKNARIEKCSNWLKDRMDWNTVVFSDEKKFNLDGPDGFQFYWHDLRGEEQYLSKRKFGGGSLMVWAAFGSGGKSELIVINGRINSADYCQLLKNNLLNCGKKIGGKNWLFQQDNASIHRSKASLNWINDNKINVLEWPSISPDLNPIENVWGILVRRLFANGRQFKSVNELESNLKNEWKNLNQNDLIPLINSMPKRCIDVIKNKGATIKY
jgi:transposase